MSRTVKLVNIVYRGPADRYICVSPNGREYDFRRGEVTEVAENDVEWFLGEPKNSPSFESPAPPEAPVISGEFEVPAASATEPEAPVGHDFASN